MTLDTVSDHSSKVLNNNSDIGSWLASKFWTYALLIIAVFLFAGAATYSLLNLRDKSEVANIHSQSTMWLVVSLQHEFGKLDNMFWRYEAADPRLRAGELLTQFDILWSRLALMEESRNAIPAQKVDSFIGAVPPLFKLIREYEPHLFESVPAGLPISAVFLKKYRALKDPIQQYMVDIHIDRSWATNTRESAMQDTRFALYAMLVGALGSILLLFLIVISQMISRQKHLIQTRAALSQSEDDRQALGKEVKQRQLIEKDRKRLVVDLEHRNDELERYAYTVSHDLKSPLITIKGFAGFLEQDVEQGNTAKVIADVARINEAVQTMSNLLEDILKLSKVNLVPELFVEVSLDETIAKSITLVTGEIESHAVDVRVELNLPIVKGEPQHLIEVFQNLISNAVKFMGEQNNPVIEIGATKQGDRVLCYVKDNGVGIAKEYQQRVFNLFERLETDTEGTGLGLSIVKRIIERHGDKIQIDSDLGKGCKFYFTLPAS